MLARPVIINTEGQYAAVIHLTVSRSERMPMFGPAVRELMAALAAQGNAPVGAVFAHHVKMSPDTFNFELGGLVSARVKAAGRVEPASCPQGKWPVKCTAARKTASMLLGDRISKAVYRKGYQAAGQLPGT